MVQWKCLPSRDGSLSTISSTWVWRGWAGVGGEAQGAEAQTDRETGNRGREAAVVIKVRNNGYRRLKRGPLHAEGEALRTLRW